MLHSCLVSFATDTAEAFEVCSFGYTVDVERRNFDVLFHDEVIDTHDGTFVRINFLLVAIGRLGNLTLEEAIENTGQDTAQRINAIQILHSRLLCLVGQGLDKVGAAQRINGIDNTTFVSDDLLSTQGNQNGLFSG